MTHRGTLLSVCLLPLLLACGGGDNTAPTGPDAPSASLTVTAEINTGVNTARITVIPNDVAPWLSHIILIDTEGALYQTALDSGKAKPLNAKAVDVIGLMRMEAPGVMLTLSEAGTISAFIESNDEGDLAPLPVSAPPLSLERFCQSATAPSDTVHAVTQDGTVVSLAVLVEGTDQIRLSETNRASFTGGGQCVMTGDTPTSITADQQIAVLSTDNDDIVLSPQAPADDIAIAQVNSDDRTTVSISAGLSTPGLSSARAAYVSDDSLGGVFRDGAVIFADAEAPRLVLISKPFAAQTLSAIDE